MDETATVTRYVSHAPWTVAEVFQAFVDWETRFRGDDPDYRMVDGPLRLGTTLADWRARWAMSDESEMVDWLHRIWNVEASDFHWQAVLRPSHARRLRDLCGFIAARTRRRREQLEAALRHADRVRRSFLLVRSLFVHAGAKAGDIGFSTPLRPLLAEYPLLVAPYIEHFGEPVPVPSVGRPKIVAVLGCLAALVLGGWVIAEVGGQWPMLAAAIGVSLGVLLSWSANQLARVPSTAMPATVGEWAVALIEEPPTADSEA